GSVAQPTPGSQGRRGKKVPIRTAGPSSPIRSRTLPGKVSCHGIDAVTDCPAARGWARGTIIVVGSVWLDVAGDPSTVTGPAVRCAPSWVRTGPFGQRRKT